MERMFSDRVETGEWTAPAAEVVEFRSVSFGEGMAVSKMDADGKLVAHATSTCQVLRGEAARGR